MSTLEDDETVFIIASHLDHCDDISDLATDSHTSL